jgi:hypothetical protein
MILKRQLEIKNINMIVYRMGKLKVRQIKGVRGIRELKVSGTFFYL